MFGSPPNMEGEFYDSGLSLQEATGVFSAVSKTASRQGHVSDYNDRHGYSFSATKGNDLYNGDKLQVPALQALFCIKL